MCRITFPNLVLVAAQDTSTHNVEICDLKEGDTMYRITFLRPKQFDFLPFTPSKIEVDGKVIWIFKTENFHGVGLLALAGEEPVIALRAKGKDGKVERVIPFNILKSRKPLGHSKSASLKSAVGQYLKCGVFYTPEERAALDRQQREQEATRQEQDRADRQQRIEAILARPRVSVFTHEGQVRECVPTANMEWQSLPTNTLVVVGTFNDDWKPTSVTETFYTRKVSGQNPTKAGVRTAHMENPLQHVAATTQGPQPVRSLSVLMDGDSFTVQVFGSWNDVQEARNKGLNGGTLVTSIDRMKGNQVEVFSVHHDRIDTIGKCPLAL